MLVIEDVCGQEIEISDTLIVDRPRANATERGGELLERRLTRSVVTLLRQVDREFGDA